MLVLGLTWSFILFLVCDDEQFGQLASSYANKCKDFLSFRKHILIKSF